MNVLANRSTSTGVIALIALALSGLALGLWLARDRGESANKPLLSGDGLLSAEDVAQFDKFPLVSLGEEHNGHPLVLAQEEVYPGLVDAKTGKLRKEGSDTVTLGYDKACEERPCEMPIVVQISPACTIPQALIADDAKDGPGKEISDTGVRAQRFGDGHVRLWMGSITVAVWDETSATPLDPEKVLASLEGANEPGRVLAKNWPAPDKYTGACAPGVLPTPRSSDSPVE